MNKLLINSTGLKISPCTYCHRKPTYFQNNINYCWKHWNQPRPERKKNSYNIRKKIQKQCP